MPTISSDIMIGGDTLDTLLEGYDEKEAYKEYLSSLVGSEKLTDIEILEGIGRAAYAKWDSDRLLRTEPTSMDKTKYKQAVIKKSYNDFLAREVLRKEGERLGISLLF